MRFFSYEFSRISQASMGELLNPDRPDSPNTWDITLKNGQTWNLPPSKIKYSTFITPNSLTNHFLITRQLDNTTVAIRVI